MTNLSGKGRAWKVLVCGGVLLALSVGFMAVAINQRRPWFGVVPYNVSGILLSQGVFVDRQWWLEGPLNCAFVMYWDPSSIEEPPVRQRSRYVVYPTGAFFLVHALERLFNVEPSVKVHMAFDLGVQFVDAFILGLMCLLMARAMGYGHAASMLFSSIPVFSFVWLPSPFYELMMTGTDQVVMFPYVLMLMLEVLRDKSIGLHERTRRSLSVIQMVVLFYGTLTDWLFLPAAGCLYIVRFVRGELGRRPKKLLARSFLFWVPVGLALSCFLAQILYFGAFEQVLRAFLRRTSLSPDWSGQLGEKPLSLAAYVTMNLSDVFWRQYVTATFGVVGKWVIWGSSLILALFLVYFLACRKWWSRGLPRALRARTGETQAGLGISGALMFLVVGTPWLHYYLLREFNSAAGHYFAALKFAPTVCIVPFVLMPATLFRAFFVDHRRSSRLWQTGSVVLASLCVVVAAGYVYSLDNERYALFGEPNEELDRLGRFIGDNTEYEDVVFGLRNWPGTQSRQFAMWANKRLHIIRSIGEIYDVVKDVEGKYRINLFLEDSSDKLKLHGIPDLISRAYECVDGDGYSLYKIKRAEFEALCAELGIGVGDVPAGTG